MIDVSDIIYDPDFVVDFQRIQVTGSFTNGNWTAVESAPSNMQGIILPANLDVLKVLPEGERDLESVKIYSLVQLNMGDDQETTQPDIILYLGAAYRVAWSRYYPQCGLWMVIAQRYQRATT